MFIVTFIGILLSPAQGGGTLAPPIENCDGSGQRAYLGVEHPAGTEWFSIKGRVLDERGNPVCGAEVTAEYSDGLRSVAGAVRGSTGPTGLDGVFFLANVKKGAPFRIRVNPFRRLEFEARTRAARSVNEAMKGLRNVKAGGVARHVGDETKYDGEAGVIVLDINLRADPEATGTIFGNVGLGGPFDSDAPATARIQISSGEPIEALVDRRTGAFVIFGVHPGKHEVTVEVSRDGRKQTARKTITVPGGAAGMATVQIGER